MLNDILFYQNAHAHWSAMAIYVLEWLERHPDNAAARYDVIVYQERAAAAYRLVAMLRGL